MFRSSRAANRARSGQRSLFRDILGVGDGAAAAAAADGADGAVEVTDTPLYATYKQKQLQQLKQLLQESLESVYEAASTRERRTVAEIAAADGDLRVLRAMAAAGVDFNRRCPDKKVPFHHALTARRLRTMKVLCELGASPDVPYANGAYPLHQCCCDSNLQIITCLLADCKASTEVKDRLGNTPLHRACLEDSLGHVRVLLDYCDESVVNIRGYEGKTALHIAVGNQNRRIIRQLLHHGAFVDAVASNGRTPIDLIMRFSSVVMMSDLANFYTSEMTKAIKATSFKELAEAPQFQQFLGFLEAVDNEFNGCQLECTALEPKEEKELMQKLVKETKLDQIEFKQIVQKLLYTESYHVLAAEESEEILKKLTGNVVRYALYREDDNLLNQLIGCGIVWWPMQKLIATRIDSVFLHTPDRGFAGVLAHFSNHFVSDHKIDWQHLVRYYAHRCSVFQLQPPEESNPNAAGFMHHPLRSIVSWCILSGRYKILESILQLEKFDLVPVSLFAAALLRTFQSNPSVSVDEQLIEEKAHVCENFAAKVVEAIYEVDTSFGKQVTIDYLLYNLPAYGNASCIDLAGKNGSALFLQTQPGQMALEKKWYGMLLNVNYFIRELVIWCGLLPLNPLLALLLRQLKRNRKILGAKQKKVKSAGDADDYCTADSGFLFSEVVDDTKAMIMEEDDEEDEENKKEGGGEEGKDKTDKKAEGEDKKEKKAEGDDKKEKKAAEASGSDGKQQQQQQQQQQHRRCNELQEAISSMLEFYQIPAVRFRYHGLSYVIMVLLMSYELLISWEYKSDWVEVVMYLIVLGFLVEEAAEFSHIMLEENVQSFFASKWNLIDIAAAACALVSFVVRMICRNADPHELIDHEFMNFKDNWWYAARLFLSVSCLLYWVRLLYVSTVLETLGPKLKMITKMTMKDMIPFLFILFIFIFGFGVLIQSLLFPNGRTVQSEDGMNLIEAVLQLFKICFYGMVGDYSLDTLMGDGCDAVYAGTENGTDKNCPHQYGRYLVPYFVMPLYVIVTEILLLNLIIALFSKTIDEIDSKSKALWQFERNDLIDEFRARSSLPPPLNIAALLLRLLLRIAQKCCPNFIERFHSKEPFKQKLVLQFLLFQAFSLRNKRHEIMRSCSTEGEAVDSLREKVEDIVQSAVEERLKSEAEERN